MLLPGDMVSSDCFHFINETYNLYNCRDVQFLKPYWIGRQDYFLLHYIQNFSLQDFFSVSLFHISMSLVSLKLSCKLIFEDKTKTGELCMHSPRNQLSTRYHGRSLNFNISNEASTTLTSAFYNHLLL